MPTIRNSEQARRLAQRRWERQRQREAEEAAGVTAASALEPVAAARARRVRALADRAEVEAARLRGELIERAKVERAIFEFARRMRDAWAHWPARIAATLAARLGADPHAVEAALGSEVRRHLEELSRDPLPGFGGAAG
jgi:phage terminase Nu1 subunit (DNA packaging protein)